MAFTRNQFLGGSLIALVVGAIGGAILYDDGSYQKGITAGKIQMARLPGPGDGVQRPDILAPGIAARLYHACTQARDRLIPINRAVHDGGRENVELLTAKDLWMDTTFHESKRHLVLAGVVVNKGAPTSVDLGYSWDSLPADSTCIFIGGEEDNIRARVVYLKDNVPVGQIREVTIRFHQGCHDKPDAGWGRIVDPVRHEMNKHIAPCYRGGSGSGHLPRPASYLDSLLKVAGVQQGGTASSQPVPKWSDSNSVFMNEWESGGGGGPWWTCSSHTCCKVL